MRIVATDQSDPTAGQAVRSIARPGPATFAGQTAPRDGILRRMGMAAKARFAANKRLEAKGVATNVGLQLANIYTIAIGILLIQFPASDLLKPISGALNYISLIASVFVQIMALIESYKDYSGRARRMHDCAVAISSLQQRLELDPRNDWQTLEWYRGSYEAVIKDADLNHDAIDYRCAQLEPAKLATRTRQHRLAILRWRIAYFWNVYGLTVTILLSPWLLGYGLIKLGLG
jgi:SMODS and SLOG-associating 2TM effector domain family 5